MRFKDSQNEYQQLQSAKIIGDVWIDAGCGSGTYTLPLSRIVSLVVALDNDPRNIDSLSRKLPQDSKIKLYLHNFNDPSWPISNVDGVLFAFSLHYPPSPKKALKNAFAHIKAGGTLVVIEYVSKIVVPWVPNPVPVEAIEKILAVIPRVKLDTIELKRASRSYSDWDNSSYLLKAYKK